LLRPLGGMLRRRRATRTPLPAGAPPPLPDGVVELDTLHGTFWFDAADEKLTPWIRRQATWEADVVRLLGRTLRPGDVVVDVGANVGLHAVHAAKLVGPTGRVYAVEPTAWTVRVLEANVWRHGCANVVVLPVAAGAAFGTARLSIPADGRSGAAVIVDGAGDVPVRPLDALVADEDVAVLKIDVEGAERDVLDGAAALLARSRRLLVIVEFRPTADDARHTLEWYRSLGFALCTVRRDGCAIPADVESLLQREDDVVNIVLRRA
jgi:FkbM family methyltransferase